MGDGIPGVGRLSQLCDRVIELAATEFDHQTLELRGYDDGDYEIRVFETQPIRNGSVDEKIEYRYNRENETIERRHYKFNKVKNELIFEDEKELESFPDPVSKAERTSDE